MMPFSPQKILKQADYHEDDDVGNNDDSNADNSRASDQSEIDMIDSIMYKYMKAIQKRLKLELNPNYDTKNGFQMSCFFKMDSYIHSAPRIIADSSIMNTMRKHTTALYECGFPIQSIRRFESMYSAEMIFMCQRYNLILILPFREKGMKTKIDSFAG